MSGENFRFRPPATPVTPALEWVLARAFGPLTSAPVRCVGETAVPLARELTLAARIGARHPPDRLAAEVGDHGAAEFKRARALAIAQELRLRAALQAVDGAAADLGIPYAPLKGQALRLGGYCAEGGRPFSDVDLLIPPAQLESLQQELLRRGFAIAGRGYEHQAPPLRHQAGGLVELHRRIPGVRLDPRRRRRSATFDELVAAQLLGTAPLAEGFQHRGGLWLPSPELLSAHALVHVLAQHGFAPAAYPGFLMLADLVDLGFCGLAGRGTLATIAPWIAREVSLPELEAALELATALAEGAPELFAPVRTRRRLLLDHFHAGATDPRYAQSLKTRIFERPPSDRPRQISRLWLLARTLSPRPTATPARSIGKLLSRPIDLMRRWRAARRTARQLTGADRR